MITYEELIDRLKSSESHIVVDSRLVKEGSIFIALPGRKTDGHMFVNDAFARGAELAVVEKPGDYSGPVLVVENTYRFLLDAGKKIFELNKPFTIAITGSNGKTTTKELTALFLESAGLKVFKTHGNYNTDVGVPLSILNQYKGQRYSVLEFGVSQPGDMDRLCSIVKPDIGVVLKVGSAHLGNFPSSEALLREKLGLLKHSQLKVVHSDLIKYLDDFDVSFGPHGDVRLLELSWQNGKTHARFRVFSEDVWMELPGIWHEGMLENLSAAISAVKLAGIDPNFEVLEDFTFPPRRFQFHHVRGITVVDDTYNSSLESIEVSVKCLQEMKKNGLYAVVGIILEQGWNALNAHGELGKLLKAFDGVLVYGSQEMPEVQVIVRNLGEKLIGVFDSKERLVAELLNELKTNDIVYFKASRGVRLDEVVDCFMEELNK